MRNSADRNRTLLLLLLDTGMRASVLCQICMGGMNNHNRGARDGEGIKGTFDPIFTMNGTNPLALSYIPRGPVSQRSTDFHDGWTGAQPFAPAKKPGFDW